MFNIVLKAIIIYFSLVNISFAYLGPGIGGGILAASIGVVVAIFAAIFGLTWFPLKRFLKKIKEKKNKKKIKID